MTSLLIDNSNESLPASHTRPLDEVLRTVEPAAVLLPPWLLQNIIAADRGRGRSPFDVPHRKIHVIAKERLLAIAQAQRWTLPGTLPEVDRLILLARPETDWVAQRRGWEVLRYYWQLLFHAKIDIAMHARQFDDAAIQKRIERIGRSAFNEACFVLHRERSLPMKADECEVYGEFAAVLFELLYFRPDLLTDYFPSIADIPRVVSLVGEDVDAEAILRQTELPGARDPGPGDFVAATAMPTRSPANIARDGKQIPSLTSQADQAAALGNHVRAAILRRRIFLASADAASPAPDLQDLDALADRLAAALQLNVHEKQEWRTVLASLINDAAEGWWNPDGRLLYDLQKLCIHYEREIYSVGVIDWLLEFCRRPLRRPQPNQRLVLICKALRSAANRVARTRLSAAGQIELTHLLHKAEQHTETRLRDALRPAVSDAIKAGGLVAKNAPEQVAANKLNEELLDSLAHRGFLTLGAVRDAISSNQIKFDDLPASGTFFARDPLFRIDRHLSDTLDGVYHRGEIYLRLFQKLSSWAFATERGRMITRTVLIPLGGSFIIVEGLDHTLFILLRALTGQHWLKISWFEEYEYRREPFGLWLNMPFVVIALMLLGMVNWREFRVTSLRFLGVIGRALGHVLIGVPRWIFTQPAVQAVIKSPLMLFAARDIFKPLAIAGVVAICLPHRVSAHTRWLVTAGIFAGMNLLLNSRHGRAVEQFIVHWLRVLATRFTSDILGNLFSGVMHFFARLLEDFERMLYAVDEWLRFRDGQPRSSLWMKATLGVIWFYIAYVARFAVNLLVEPQINPIKHFPVVTVSHKIILPTLGLFATAFESLGLSVGRARTLATATVFCIPGIFGFLAWELRANWKLYRANRPKVLKPIAIGSHGETMARLLRPGFHSGTVPKLFAHLRKVQRNADRYPGESSTPVHDEAAEHVSHPVSDFIEREFIYRLNQHPLWRDTPISLCEGDESIRLGPTRITVALCCPALDAAPAHLFFEQRAGWIVAGIDQPGWILGASPAQSQLLSAALLGLYKIAGVDLVKEQIEHAFAPRPVTFELSSEKITFWPQGQFDKPIARLLHVNDDEVVNADDPVSARKLLLRFVPVTWDEWVRIWDANPEGGGGAVLPEFRVLPG